MLLDYWFEEHSSDWQHEGWSAVVKSGVYEIKQWKWPWVWCLCRWVDSKALQSEKVELEMSVGCPVAVGFGVRQKVWKVSMALGIILCRAVGVDKGDCVQYKRRSGAQLNFRGRMKKRSQQRRVREKNQGDWRRTRWAPHRSQRMW